jgi:hypothetical protein
VKSCAELLGIERKPDFSGFSPERVCWPRSTATRRLLKRSRLSALEKALSEELISSKQSIVRDQTEAELGDLLDNSLRWLKPASAASRNNSTN